MYQLDEYVAMHTTGHFARRTLIAPGFSLGASEVHWIWALALA